MSQSIFSSFSRFQYGIRVLDTCHIRGFIVIFKYVVYYVLSRDLEDLPLKFILHDLRYFYLKVFPERKRLREILIKDF